MQEQVYDPIFYLSGNFFFDAASLFPNRQCSLWTYAFHDGNDFSGNSIRDSVADYKHPNEEAFKGIYTNAFKHDKSRI